MRLFCKIQFCQMDLIQLGLFLLGVVIFHLFFDIIKEYDKCNNNQLLTQFGQKFGFDSMQNPRRYACFFISDSVETFCYPIFVGINCEKWNTVTIINQILDILIAVLLANVLFNFTGLLQVNDMSCRLVKCGKKFIIAYLA